MTPLRHRLAALAFPPGQRRAELIGTLADTEEELGSRAPGPREAVNILRHGLRARLGRPRSRMVVPIAVLITMLGACVGASVATTWAWAFVPPLPTGERAAEISRTVFPGLHVYGGGEAPDFALAGDSEGTYVYGFVTYDVRHTDATRDLTVYEAGVRERLEAAGWAVHDSPAYRYVDERYWARPADRYVDERFWARHDGLVLQFSLWYRPDAPVYDGDGGGSFTLSRTPPDWMWWPATAGALIGGVLTFLVLGWASRRTARPGSPMPFVAVVYVAAILAWLLFTWRDLAQWWRPEPSSPPVQPLWSVFLTEGPSVPLLLLIPMTPGILLLAAAHRPYPPAWLWALIGRRPVWQRAVLAATGLALVVTAAVVCWPTTVPRPCGPDGLPRPPSAAETRISTEARVYVDPAITLDQRNWLQAAILRSGGSYGWRESDPAHGCGVRAPWYEVSFVSPGRLDRLRAEVSGMPGVLAVAPDV